MSPQNSRRTNRVLVRGSILDSLRTAPNGERVRRSMVQLFDYQKLHQGAKHGHGWFMFDAFVFTVDPPL